MRYTPGRTYRIYHRPSKVFKHVGAASPEEALRVAGWTMAECWVRLYTPGHGWANITPRIPKP